MDWVKEGEGNRNPIIILNGDDGLKLIHIEGKEKESIQLDASKSYDKKMMNQVLNGGSSLKHLPIKKRLP